MFCFAFMLILTVVFGYHAFCLTILRFGVFCLIFFFSGSLVIDYLRLSGIKVPLIVLTVFPSVEVLSGAIFGLYFGFLIIIL